MRPVIKILGIAVLAVSAVSVGAPATANQLCGERDEFVEKLNRAYGERPASAGLESEGNLVEIFRSEEGSWTILATQPTGISCIVAVGEAWTEGDWKAGSPNGDLSL